MYTIRSVPLRLFCYLIRQVGQIVCTTTLRPYTSGAFLYHQWVLFSSTLHHDITTLLTDQVAEHHTAWSMASCILIYYQM